MKNFLFITASILLDAIGIGGGFDRCSSKHYDDVYLNVSTNTVVLDAQGTTASFVDISSNSYWQVSNRDRWFDVQPTVGINNGQIRITAAPNRSTGVLYSSFDVICGGISVEVEVVQKGTEE